MVQLKNQGLSICLNLCYLVKICLMLAPTSVCIQIMWAGFFVVTRKCEKYCCWNQCSIWKVIVRIDQRKAPPRIFVLLAWYKEKYFEHFDGQNLISISI